MDIELQRNRKKFVFVVTVKGSAMSFVYGFAKYVASKGYDVTIIADGMEETSMLVGEGILKTTSVKMARNPHPFQDLVSLFSMFLKLKEISPDIVSYGTPKASLLTSIASFLARTPFRIYQLWGLRLETVEGVQRKVLGLMEWITSRLSTSVIANSESLSKRYVQLGLNSNKNVDVIGKGSSHGVDLIRFAREAEIQEVDSHTTAFLNARHGNFVVGFIGRLHEDKGIGTLIEAVRQLRSDGVPISLLLLGKDEGANLGLTDKLDGDTFLAGHVLDIRPYLSVMDILVLPSLREGFPNVVLEAAAMSVPAVVSNGTGVVDSVVDGETGKIAEVKNSIDFANAIRILLEDAEYRQELGEQARLRVENHFDQRVVWEQTLAYLLSCAPKN